MKPGDEVLIRAKLINVRERDNEATVGFDSTTTAVVPLGAVSTAVVQVNGKIGWMDSTDFSCELGHALGGNKVYPDQEDCRKGHPCIDNIEDEQPCKAQRVIVFDADQFDADQLVAPIKLWRISQAVKLQQQNDLAGLQQFYDYVKGVVGEQEPKP